MIDLVLQIACGMRVCCFSLGCRNNWPVGPVFFLFIYLKQPDEAPWNAWQLLSKFLFKLTQISAWRQSGKPWTSSDQINVVNFVKVSYLEYHIHVNSICVGPGVLEILFKSLFEGIWNLVKLVKFPDSLHGGVVPDITIKLPSQTTVSSHKVRDSCGFNVYLAVPEYSRWMMADTFPNILAYIRAGNINHQTKSYSG